MEKKIFRNIMRIILPAVGISVIFCLIWEGLRYILVDDTESYTRVMMHELYQQENVDILFSGASLSLYAFDTSLLDEELNANTFNAASASQNIDVTYYLIKDVLKRNNVKQVFLDVGPSMAFTYRGNRETEDMVSAYTIGDYLKWSPRKIATLLRGSEPDTVINSFLPARRNWKDIFDVQKTGILLQKKGDVSYSQYGYEFLDHGTERYKGKGYVESEEKIPVGSFTNYGRGNVYGMDSIEDGWLYYIQKIADVCKRYGAELILVCTPLPDFTLTLGGWYDDYHAYMQDAADEMGVDFWDFIYVKEEYMSTNEAFYKDLIHLNKYGAEAFIKLFSRIVKGELDIKDISYERIAEKLDSKEVRVLGININDDKSRTIISNGIGELEYKVTVQPAGKEEYVLQEFSSNKDIFLPDGETGFFTVISRQVDGGDIQTFQYEYK